MAKVQRKGKQLAYFIPDSLYARLCRVADRREAKEGLPIRHTDLLRHALARFLAEEEKALGITQEENNTSGNGAGYNE